MQTERQATPRPWFIAEYGMNSDGSTKFFAIKHGEKTIANMGTNCEDAYYIVTVVNAHAALVNACKSMLACCGGASHWNGATHEALKDIEHALQLVDNLNRAALAALEKAGA